MTAGTATESLPDPLAALRGCRVMRFIIDDSLTLALRAAGREAVLRVDGEGRFERDGRSYRFSPDKDPAGLGPILSLMNARIDAVSVATDGTLRLCFEDGSQLLALPDDHQVTWSARVLGGGSAACIAEGKVVWE